MARENVTRWESFNTKTQKSQEAETNTIIPSLTSGPSAPTALP